MRDEFNALVANKTWCLVPYPGKTNIVFGKWVFKYKFNSNITLSRYKTHCLACGYSQQPDIDYNKTFSPSVKLATSPLPAPGQPINST
jgi:hypothetical protein